MMSRILWVAGLLVALPVVGAAQTCSAPVQTTIPTSTGGTQPVTRVTMTNGSTQTSVYYDSNQNVVRSEDTDFWGNMTRVSYYVESSSTLQPSLTVQSHIRMVVDDGVGGTSGNHPATTTSDTDSNVAKTNAETARGTCGH